MHKSNQSFRPLGKYGLDKADISLVSSAPNLDRVLIGLLGKQILI